MPWAAHLRLVHHGEGTERGTRALWVLQRRLVKNKVSKTCCVNSQRNPLARLIAFADPRFRRLWALPSTARNSLFGYGLRGDWRRGVVRTWKCLEF